MSNFDFANAKFMFETENAAFSTSHGAYQSVRIRSIAEQEQLMRQIIQ